MGYTPYVWRDGASGLTPISAARLNAIEQGLASAANIADNANNASAASIFAPPPSGNDDTATLNNLLAIATATGGTLVLQDGNYIANLVGPQSASQAMIVGQGRNQTTIRAATNANPVIKFRGVSGASISGGGVQHLRVLPVFSGGGVGIEFSGTISCRAEDVDVFAAGGSEIWDEGVRFHNEDTGEVTRFSTFDGTITNATLPVRYKRLNGNESFNGSGLVGSTVINALSTQTTLIQIDAGCVPNNSPMFVHGYAANTTVSFITNNNGAGRVAAFYGNIGLNNFSNNIIGAGNTNVAFMGGISAFTGNTSRLGRLYLANKINYDASATVTTIEYKPATFVAPLSSSATTIGPGMVAGGASAMISCTITAPNYSYSYVLLGWQNPTSGAGVITQLANPVASDTTGSSIGAPTLAWAGNGLTITNANYTSSFIANVTYTQLGGASVSGNMLTQ